MRPEQRDDLEKFLNSLRALEKAHVANTIDGRRRDADRFQRLFQICGAIIILSSVAIPFVSAQDSEVLQSKDTIISILALLVAGLTSLTSFFAWGDAWRNHRLAHSNLVRLHSLWELKMIEVSFMDDHEKAKEKALSETKKVLESTGISMDSVLEEYFKSVKSSDPTAKAG